MSNPQAKAKLTLRRSVLMFLVVAIGAISLKVAAPAEAASPRTYGCKKAAHSKARTACPRGKKAKCHKKKKKACARRLRRRAFKSDKTARAAVSSAVSAGSARRRCQTTGVSVGFGSLSIDSLPSACWRPYADFSPFNTPISASASTAADSSTLVGNLLESEISYMVAGDPARDGGEPTFYPSAGDPTFTLHCTEDWGTCPIEGMAIQVPDVARPAGVWPDPDNQSDGHMTIIDQQSGWEYDLFNVQSKPQGGGELAFSWGGRTRIDGDGLDSYATAARFGNLAGLVRAPELEAGVINHALVISVPCTEGYVWPADHEGYDCSDNGMSSDPALAMGQRLQLNIPVDRIAEMPIPTWKKAVLRAFSVYGAYVNDTTGTTAWSLGVESGATYTSFGRQDGMVTLAKDLGMEPEDYNGNGFQEYWFDLASDVSWSKLRVVE